LITYPLKEKISLIAAMSENHIIGRNNRLPWNMPADHEHFRKITAGKPFIMGRNSFLSEDVLLSDYKSVILSHKKDIILPEKCFLALSIREAFELLKDEPEIFVLGGEKVFRQVLPFAGYIYLTVIHSIIDGDASFPSLNTGEWEIARQAFNHSDEENPFDYTFIEYTRKSE
jgi:dihydrofolate reductase